MRGEIHEQEVNLDNLLSFHEILVPRQRDKESLNSSTQAKPEEQLEEQHRQGAGVQPYPVIT